MPNNSQFYKRVALFEYIAYYEANPEYVDDGVNMRVSGEKKNCLNG